MKFSKALAIISKELGESTDLYGELCDAVERSRHNWPLEGPINGLDVMHTSSSARTTANRILEIIGWYLEPVE